MLRRQQAALHLNAILAMSIPIEHSNDPDAKFLYVPPSEGLQVVTEDHRSNPNHVSSSHNVPSPSYTSSPNYVPSPNSPKTPARYHGASRQHDAYASLLTTPDTIRRRIEASATKNSSLLVILRDTGNAPEALTVKKIQIEKIKEEIKDQERVVRTIAYKVEELSDSRRGKSKTLNPLEEGEHKLMARVVAPQTHSMSSLQPQPVFGEEHNTARIPHLCERDDGVMAILFDFDFQLLR